MSSKRRKKEHTKSPSTHSAYYNKMISAFSNNSKYPTKNIRKIYNHNGNIIRKKGGKEIGSKKKIVSYYDPHTISKSNDERQKSTNIRSLPLSLMNSFEKSSQEKVLKKKYKNSQVKNYKKIANQVFYHKGKINVSGQHLKFAKPKSKSNISQHSENSSHHFSKSLAFSGGNTPISPPFYQDMNVKGGKKGDKFPYTFVPSNYQKGIVSGVSYEQMGYPTYQHAAMIQRPETNVNMYDEEMSFLSSGENSKNHSFYHNVSNSFTSQTYDNPKK